MTTEPISPEETDDELEADDDDDFDPAPLSFFADAHTDRSKLRPHELADVHDRDARISTNVYRIYLGKLSARGLITPKDAGRAYWRAQHADSIARSRRRAALRPERHEPKEEKPIMPKNEEKEPKETASSAARDAAVSLAKTSGVAPTIAEVKRALAKSYPDVTDFAIRQALKRAGIAFTSVKGQRPGNSATEQKKTDRGEGEAGAARGLIRGAGWQPRRDRRARGAPREDRRAARRDRPGHRGAPSLI